MVAPAENHNATLLIVDDDAAARERLREIFETAQYRVVTATEAASALRVLKGVRCDLVALDLEMPGVDGLALCKLLRAQPTTTSRSLQRPASCCRASVCTSAHHSASGPCSAAIAN